LGIVTDRPTNEGAESSPCSDADGAKKGSADSSTDDGSYDSLAHLVSFGGRRAYECLQAAVAAAEVRDVQSAGIGVSRAAVGADKHAHFSLVSHGRTCVATTSSTSPRPGGPSIGRRIAEIRRERGITQIVLADRLRYSVYFSQLENVTNVTMHTLALVANALDARLEFVPRRFSLSSSSNTMMEH
jgi:hypothetical protein